MSYGSEEEKVTTVERDEEKEYPARALQLREGKDPEEDSNTHCFPSACLTCLVP